MSLTIQCLQILFFHQVLCLEWQLADKENDGLGRYFRNNPAMALSAVTWEGRPLSDPATTATKPTHHGKTDNTVLVPWSSP